MVAWTKRSGCAQVHPIAPANAFHFVNRLDRLKDVKFATGQGLVLDEIGLCDREVDDAKALTDVKKTRDVQCRNSDGTIPAGTVRGISTNWTWETCWPPTAFMPKHLSGIKRRVTWVDITTDLRLMQGAPVAPVVHAAGAPDVDIAVQSDDEDVFGFRGQAM